jgi:hypothetical protein
MSGALSGLRLLGRFRVGSRIGEQCQEVGGCHSGHRGTREVRHVARHDVITLRRIRQAGHHRVFEVGKGQLAGASEDGFIGDRDVEVGQQPVHGLVGFGGTGRFGQHVVERRDGMAGQHRGDFAGARPAQDGRRILVVKAAGFARHQALRSDPA